MAWADPDAGERAAGAGMDVHRQPLGESVRRRSTVLLACAVAGLGSSASGVGAALAGGEASPPSVPGESRLGPAPPTGDPQGIALARKVNRFYAAAPRLGVRLVGRGAGVRLDVVLVLVRGVESASVATLSLGGDVVKTIGHRTSGFVWTETERCWRADPDAVIPRGQKAITVAGSRFFAPRRVGRLARVACTSAARPPGSVYGCSTRSTLTPGASFPSCSAPSPWAFTSCPRCRSSPLPHPAARVRHLPRYDGTPQRPAKARRRQCPSAAPAW